jgi:tetratricopeptide (TPR) repeat protein
VEQEAMVALDEATKEEAIALLGAYSLIQRDAREKMLSLHRLVQAVLREGMQQEEQELWVVRAVQAIQAAFPWPEHATWSQCERLLAQALSAADLIEQYHLTTWEAGRLLNASAAYLAEHARYPEAELLYQRALRIWEESLGPKHPEVAYPLNNLANLYYNQGKDAEAERLYERALRIWEASLGRDHPEVAYPLNGLATLYQAQGKYEEAEGLYERALRIWEARLFQARMPLFAHR